MNNDKMKAAMLYGVKDLRVEEIDKPQIDSSEILVRIKAATTCGTDLKIFQRGYVDRVIKLPTIFGHEWAGDVVDTGDGVTWPEKGMRIRAGNSAPCLRCTMCQKHKFNLCENMTWLWGAYAEYMRVPAQTVVVNTQEIPPHVTYEEAAVTEPLACVLHGAKKTGIELGHTVAIIGAGSIGLLHLLVAKKLGAEKVIVSDLIPNKLEFAEKLGAEATINARKNNVVRKIKQLTNGYGADVVIEAIGLPSTWEQALKCVRKGGTVLEFGGCAPGTRIHIATELLHYDEIAVLGAFHATPSDFKKALNLIATKAIDVRPLITRKIPLEMIKDAFDILKSKSDVKIAIAP